MSLLADIVGNSTTAAIDLSLLMTTIWVINKDFAVYSSSAVTIGQYAASKTSHWYQNDILNAVFLETAKFQRSHAGENVKFLIENRNVYEQYQGENCARALDELNDLVLSATYANKERAIWLIDSFAAYELLEADLLNSYKHYKRNGYFCIIYTGREENRLDVIRRIFARLFVIYVTNVNVFLTVGKALYIYTYFPFHAHSCNYPTMELYSIYRNILNVDQFKLKKIFFPSKVTNMNRCSVNVTSVEVVPFLFIHKDEKSGQVSHVSGIEGSIVELMAERFNFKLNIVELDVIDYGYIFSNGTAIGAMKMLINAETNLSIAAYMYDKLRSVYLQPGYSYNSCPLRVVLPTGHPMSPYERLIKPFRYILWICLTSNLLFGILVIYAIKFLDKIYATNLANQVFGHRNRIPFTNFWLTFYGGAIHGILPEKSLSRFLLLIWIFATFILRNAYVGQLYVILQDGRTLHTIKTLEELSRYNFTFYTARNLKKILFNTLRTNNIQIFDSSNNSFAAVMHRIHSGSYNEALIMYEYVLDVFNQRYAAKRQHLVNILPEKLIETPITMYMCKHSYFVHQWDAMLKNVVTSGIVRRFESLYLSRYIVKQSGSVPVNLSFSLLSGLFNIYYIILILCVLIFLLELLSQRFRKLRNILNFFNI